MACYVDTVPSYPGRGLRPMADQLGIPRRFFKDHPWRWHHDLPEHLRVRAVELGAREVGMHEIGALLRTRRAALVPEHPRRFDGCR
ncbi:MAG: DUF4031 domain-containing protein [Jatrophihabitantaceae bacterium]